MAPPLYQIVAGALRERITRRQRGFREGDPLPTEYELADEFKVSRDTIRNALLALRTEGLIESFRGTGSYVRRRQATIARPPGAGEPPEAQPIEITTGIVTPPPEIAGLLQLKPEESCLLRRRVIHMGYDPVQIGCSWYREGLVRDTPIPIAEPTGRSIFLIFREDLGLEVAPYDEYVTTRMPTPEETSELDLGSGVPVFEVNKTISTTSGLPIVTERDILAGDRYELTFPITP